MAQDRALVGQVARFEAGDAAVEVGRLDVEEVSGLHVGVAIGVRGARDAV